METLKKLNYIFTRKQKWEIFRLFIVITIGSGLELLGVSCILPVIRAITASDTILSSGTYLSIYRFLGLTSVKQFVLLMLVGMVLVFTVKNAFLIFMYRMQYKFQFVNKRILADRMLECYLKQPYLFHVFKNSSELLRNINGDAVNFYSAVSSAVRLATELMVCAVLGVYLLILDKTITIAVVVLMLIMLVIFIKVYKKILLRTGENNRYYTMQMNKWVQQAFGGIKEVKVLNKERFFYEKYNQVCGKHAKSEYRYHTLLSIPKPIVETACIAGMLGAIAIKYYRGIMIEYFVPVISVFAVAAFRLMPSFNRITENLGSFFYYKSSIDAVYHDLKEIEDLNKQQVNILNDDLQKIDFQKRIEIQNVTFRYPNTDKDVLNGICMQIEKNTSVAFIGPSGAGKTTLADLILGILQPDNGEILLDGTSIYQDVRAWHRIIGYIPQNIYLMDDSIRRNVAFGVDDQFIDEKKLENAIEQAQLKELIESLPQGLDTEIGERGIRLSGGQRQRIGIARALYHEPQILILDEATSALDNDTEKAVMDAIEALHGKMTLIIIAHRLTTIRNCDHVYEVKDGEISQQR